MSYLSADELLAGASLAFDVEVPRHLLGEAGPDAPAKVRVRPLTVRDVQRVTRASKDDDTLLSALLLKEAVVAPALSFEQVHALPAGLARHLLAEVTRVSGLDLDAGDVSAAVQAPLARACLALAREFGWTPQEIGDLTVAQILLYLEMLTGNASRAEAP